MAQTRKKSQPKADGLHRLLRIFSSRSYRFAFQAVFTVFAIGIAGGSSYVLGTSHAATPGNNISYCAAHGISVNQNLRSTNACVYGVQGFVNYYTRYRYYSGYQTIHPICSPQGIDGKYGANTTAAIKCYQASYLSGTGVTATGEVGPKTYDQMLKDCAEMKGTSTPNSYSRAGLNYCYN